MNDIVVRANFASSRLCVLASTLALLLSSPNGSHAGDPPACSGVVIETGQGSQLDAGYAGKLSTALATGGATSWDVLKRCSTGDQAACNSDDDCAQGDCVATCDCVADASCELAGPVHERRCFTTFTECTTNADCPDTVACVHMYGPPLPVAAGGVPFCLATSFDGAGSGAFDSATGEASLALNLRQRVFLGDQLARPCPRCGPPDQEPQVGDMFTCEGGQFPGATCMVEGVTPFFGGTSSSCPPTPGNNITPTAMIIRLDELTTGEIERTAKLPCSSFPFTGNPLSVGSNPKCLDDAGPSGAVCASNADCTRCSGDSTVKCTSNGDCTGKGTCGQWPDQPVTCGHWCHCGFCNNDGNLPCMGDDQCPDGQTCVKGTGAGTATNAGQAKANDCTQDFSVCGSQESERCKNTKNGSCSLQPYRTCESDEHCQLNGAGTCIIAGRQCFEPRISRSGEPSPVGKYCAFEDKACASNADCATQSGDFCIADASRPQMVAMFCVRPSTSSFSNSIVGVTGPATLSIPSFVKVCRCEGSEPGCEDVCASTPTSTTTTTTTTSTTTTSSTTTTTSSTTTTTLKQQVCGNGTVESPEDCDDGNTTWTNGEHCTAQCEAVDCGDTNDSSSISTTDAQFALRAAVGSVTCAVKVCDVNMSGGVNTTDALLLLRKGVGQAVTLNCPQ